MIHNPQILLGRLVVAGRPFRIWIKDRGTYQVIYRWNQHKIELGDIVGYITTIEEKHNLVLSTVERIFLGPKPNYTWCLSTIPIQHCNDTKTLEELSVSKLVLSKENIYCVFEKVPEHKC